MTTTDGRIRLLDVNVLLALAHPVHVHHASARAWFSTVAHFATTPITETALVRLSLHPDVAGQVITPPQALGLLDAVRALPNHHFLPDTASLAAPVIASRPAGTKQITDLHLVNLAASVDAALVTYDARLARSLHPDDRRHVEVVAP